MDVMSEREYSDRSGLSRGAIQNDKRGGRLVFHADGSINAAASDLRRAEMTDPVPYRRASGGDAAMSVSGGGGRRKLSDGAERTYRLSGAGTSTGDPEEEGHAGGPGAGSGLSPRAAGA